MTENYKLLPSPPKPPRQEVVDLVREQLQAMLDHNNLEGAKTLLVPVQPADIAEVIGGLPETMQVIGFRLLSKDEAAEVYEYLDSTVQQALLEEFKRQEVLDVVGKMSPDDRARLFDELPAKVVSRLLPQLNAAERQATALLLGYEPDTAGRIMTPEYISLKEHWTITEALERIRSQAKFSETIYYLYVTDPFRYLTGILSLRDLVTAQPYERVGEVMTREVISVPTDMDQEEVARVIQRYDFLAVPVVDAEGRLVGIVTVDDVLDILEQEATEDIYSLSGVQADGDNYFQSNLLTIARKRVLWLLILLVANTFTSGIINSQEQVLASAVALAAFIPLLTGTGGNVGAQSSTVVIRGLSTDQIQIQGAGSIWRAARLVIREGLAGALLGMMLCIVAMAWAFVLEGDLSLAAVVGVSLFLITLLASISGTVLPLFFHFLKLDPALMSAPFITTMVDILGLLTYFSMARLILGL